MKVEQLIRKIQAEKCKRSFYYFVKSAFKYVQIGHTFRDDKYIEIICNYCEEIQRGNIRKSVICVPPSTGKSTIISVLFPVWLWINDPSLRLITISYSPSLSIEFASKSLDLITSNWFISHFPNVKIKSRGKTASGHYKTTAGGWRFATSPGSILTGWHSDFILQDDPAKAGTTLTEFQSLTNWASQTLPSRLIDQKTGRISCIAQRLHEADLPGYYLAKNWDSLILPMSYDPEISSHHDWRSTLGETLSQRFPQDVIDALTLELGIHADSQLQQRPTSDQTAIFKKKHLEITISKEEFDQLIKKSNNVVLSIDLATLNKESSDYSALVIAFKIDDNYYIYRDHLFKLEFSDQVEEILNIYKQYKQYNPNIVIENKSNGPAVISVLKKAGLPVEEFDPGSKSKIERANSISYLLNLGCVYFNELSHEATQQLLNFPRAKYDDVVDCTTQALLYLSRDQTKSIWEILMERNEKKNQ